MKIKPLGDKVVIKPIREDVKTKSGIVLPDTAEKKKPVKGEVLAVGPGKTLPDGKVLKPEVSVGDKVLYNEYGPTEIKLDGKELMIAGSEDLLGILE